MGKQDCNLKAGKEDTLGAPRPQTCAKGLRPLDSNRPMFLGLSILIGSGWCGWVTESLWASGPMKSGAIPFGNAGISLGMIPGFHRMLRK